MMQEMTVQAKDLRAGDRMVTETLGGAVVTMYVCGVFSQKQAAKDEVKVFTRDADFHYDGAEFVTVQRGV